MAVSELRIVTIVYVSLNIFITLIVSILGVKYVRREFKMRKERELHSLQIESNTTSNSPQQHKSNKEQKYQTEQDDEVKDNNYKIIKTKQVNENKENEIKKLSKMSFIKLWLKITWKMRSVYLSLAVHAFDVLTDILVLMNWWKIEDVHGDIKYINAKLMAWCGIATLLFHKIVSTIAFWLKEKNIYRCILQFFDLLIFEEIYVTHQKIVAQFRNQMPTKSKKQEDDDDAVETTTSFKYIRSLEAVFESIPQSVLQMVFIIRTRDRYETDMFLISLLSIGQSIVSMTNSILKNDNLYMNIPKFKRHRKRLPPTLPFLKHALCRLAEVFSRIAVLSLFWTVLGGQAFAVLLGVEVLFIISLTMIEWYTKQLDEVNVDEILLRSQAFVTLPSEMIFALKVDYDGDAPTFDSMDPPLFQLHNFLVCLIGACWTCCCCYWPAVYISRLCCIRGGIKGIHYYHPDFRIGTSFMEWTILIIYALSVDDGKIFLFSFDYGLSVFIVGIVLFFVYSQYLGLMPNFALPQGKGIRSIWGYALNGELQEIKRLYNNKVIVLTEISFRSEMSEISFGKTKENQYLVRIVIDCINAVREGLNLTETNVNVTSGHIFYVKFKTKPVTLSLVERNILFDAIEKALKDENKSFNISLKNDFEDDVEVTFFAMANGQQHIVEWLETELRAKDHKDYLLEREKGITEKQYARDNIDEEGQYFGKEDEENDI